MSKPAKERLMNVLLAPTSPRRPRRHAGANQYTFKVRRRRQQPEVKAAVELMLFGVKVDGVQVVNEPGKDRFGAASAARQGLEGRYVRLADGRDHYGPGHRSTSSEEGADVMAHQAQTDSPGARFVVRVDVRTWKGGPSRR